MIQRVIIQNNSPRQLVIRTTMILHKPDQGARGGEGRVESPGRVRGS